MKTKKLSEFIQEWNNITLMKLFEIPVIDKRTNEQIYIIFDIEIRGRSFVATHESLNKKQEKSKKISFVKITIDYSFSIDSNLEELFDACITAIIDSEYFELTND